MNRREFIARTTAAAAGGLMVGSLARGALATSGALPNPAGGVARVSLVLDPAHPLTGAAPVVWAAQQLQKALEQRGVTVNRYARIEQASAADLCVLAAARNSPIARDAGISVPSEAEALVLAPARIGGREALVAGGSDVRGLVYALTELADAISLGVAPAAVLRPVHAVTDRPTNAVRSVMRMAISEVEDKPWFNDRDFWRGYLSQLVTQRFNRFNLAFGLGYDRPNNLHDTYFYFAYPFLVSVPGYDVRATNLPNAERDRNLEMLRFISDEAAARGLEFQLGVWTHAYRWITSPNANHVIEGLTPETQGTYSRDALAIVLKECPGITGVTFRIHGESGVAEGSYDLWKTIFDGCVRSGRRVRLDMHAKGMDQPTMDAAFGTGLPIEISPKFWAEHRGLPYHQAAIREAELPKRERGSGLYAQSDGARSFLRYGYGDLLTEDRRYGIVHRIWPGTQRLLLSGDPVFGAAYGRAMTFCGSRGCEIFDPLSFKGREGSSAPGNGGRNGYAEAALRPAGGDFEKYSYTYRQWGRMLYNPASPASTWDRQLQHDFGMAGAPAGAALAHASRVLPLVTTAHTPSASNYSYWPEIAANMSLLDNPKPAPYGETKSPSRFGNASPLDPQLFSRPDEFAAHLLKGETSSKYSPIEVAQWLEDLAKAALENLVVAEAKASDPHEPRLRRLAVDVRAQSELGNYYAAKFRAAVLYAIYEETHNAAALNETLAAYRRGRSAWARLVEATTGVYTTDLTFGDPWWDRGHWADRMAAIDQDIAAVEQKRSVALSSPSAVEPRMGPAAVATLIQTALARPVRAATAVWHTPPTSFHRGDPLTVTLAANPNATPPTQARLYYRRAHQAESWQILAMDHASDGSYRATIPAETTNSAFPVLYYFEVTHPSGDPTIYPGLGSTLSDAPYFAVRSGSLAV